MLTLKHYVNVTMRWRSRLDATLKELTSLVKEVNVDARKKGTFFDFAIVYPDPRTPVYRMRDIGATCAGRKGMDDGVTLALKRFQIGDFLDISISPPRGGGGGPMGMGGGGGPMRNRMRPYWEQCSVYGIGFLLWTLSVFYSRCSCSSVCRVR